MMSWYGGEPSEGAVVVRNGLNRWVLRLVTQTTTHKAWHIAEQERLATKGIVARAWFLKSAVRCCMGLCSVLWSCSE